MTHFADIPSLDKDDGEIEIVVEIAKDPATHTLLAGGKFVVSAWPDSYPGMFAITAQGANGEARHFFCQRNEMQAMMLAIGQALAET